IIVFCIGFGIVTSYYAEKVRVLVDFFMALEKIIMKLMLSVMWFSPIGITSLICGSLLELNDIWLAAGAMSNRMGEDASRCNAIRKGGNNGGDESKRDPEE
ncbi:hypothetical protein TELCIR_20098, partial [Teladorsagia circumcincta]